MTAIVDWIFYRPDEWVALDNDDNYIGTIRAVYDVNRGAVLYWVDDKDFTTLQKAKDYCERCLSA